MKNKSCPNKDVCWDYDASNCEGCAIGEKIARLVRQNKKLKAENAALQKRLENAVELPCKVGDTIYYIHGTFIRSWQVRRIYIDKNRYSIACDQIGTDNYICVLEIEYGIWWFTDLNKAKARLAELKGGKK